MRKLMLLAVLLSVSGAGLFAGEPARSSLTLVRQFPPFEDEEDLRGLAEAVGQSWDYYRQLPPETVFYFGPDAYTAEQMVRTMSSIGQFLSQPRSAQDLNRFLRSDFNVYRSSGASPRGEVTFSAYFEASLKGSLTPDSEYRFPLYGRPPELVDAQLGDFDPQKKGDRIAGRLEGRSLVPYYTREEIDSKGRLFGRGLEIAWAKNPLDIFLLQIQGSGSIEMPNGQAFHIRYAGDNGRPYRSLGLSLIESGAIPKSEFSKARMVQYLNGLSDQDRQKALNVNPRYIFFELAPATTPTRGSLMVPLTAERSIASDPQCYPPGALAWIRTQRPVVDEQGQVKGLKNLSRFVLSQDEGGAIKGPGRIDFFVGKGLRAEKTAESLWYPGELYFFVRRPAPR
jgi:membrane-bound lytic murein transglycosylase A